MEVPRLGVESELQLLAYATATAMPDQSQVCKLHHSLRQCQILNPLSEARDQAHILMDTSSPLSHNGEILFYFTLLLLLLLFSFLATLRHTEFLGQGSDPSHSCC